MQQDWETIRGRARKESYNLVNTTQTESSKYHHDRFHSFKKMHKPVVLQLLFLFALFALLSP